jgi:hypothetical protein
MFIQMGAPQKHVVWLVARRAGQTGIGRAGQWCSVLSACLPWGAEDQVELAELQGQR